MEHHAVLLSLHFRFGVCILSLSKSAAHSWTLIAFCVDVVDVDVI